MRRISDDRAVRGRPYLYSQIVILIPLPYAKYEALLQQIEIGSVVKVHAPLLLVLKTECLDSPRLIRGCDQHFYFDGTALGPVCQAAQQDKNNPEHRHGSSSAIVMIRMHFHIQGYFSCFSENVELVDGDHSCGRLNRNSRTIRHRRSRIER